MSRMQSKVVVTRRRLRSVGRSVLLVCAVVASIAACGPGRPPGNPPLVTVENKSGVAVSVFSLSAKGEAILQTTLADGGIYNSEPAGSQCDPDGSYFVMASGRRVATLERPGCTGGTLVVTREMLTGPEVVVTPAP